MVFDAHNRAFAFFKGSCTRGIYDNMKTAVDTVFIGKDRQFNRRFLQMCGHYLVEPTACSPVSGWAKGQVRNQVGVWSPDAGRLTQSRHHPHQSVSCCGTASALNARSVIYPLTTELVTSS